MGERMVLTAQPFRLDKARISYVGRVCNVDIYSWTAGTTFV